MYSHKNFQSPLVPTNFLLKSNRWKHSSGMCNETIGQSHDRVLYFRENICSSDVMVSKVCVIIPLLTFEILVLCELESNF